VRLGVVEFEVDGDHAGTLAGALECCDHVGERFVVGGNPGFRSAGEETVHCLPRTEIRR
jgi:hypothetical protein